MAFSRRLGVVSILSACWLVAAVGCSDDEDRKGNSGEAGEGGDDGGGKGGTPAGGGASNNGGKAGSAGSAGSGTAGDAGSGGTAGDAGSGSGGEAGSGVVAGAGGEGGSGTTGGGGEGGSGVVGGEGGGGGEPPALAAQSCVWQCEDHDDCVRIDAPPGRCNEVTKLCEDPAEVCTADADCYPKISGWEGPCEATIDCGDDYLVCVDYQGASYCALLDHEDFGGCAEYDYDVVTVDLVEGGQADVCGDPAALCNEGKCDFRCDDSSCGDGAGDTCNPVSGVCECQSGTECDTGVCVDNRCTQCAIDDDCLATAAQTGLDKCVAGKCGCSDVGSCPAGDFAAATLACQ